MDGIKKAALFLSGLEWKTVDLLLGRLDPETAKSVRREMMSLGNVSEAETRNIANEFLRAAGGGKQNATVVEEHYVPKVSAGFYGPPKPKTSSPTSKPLRFPAESFEPRTRKPFDFLRNEQVDDIVQEIKREHPQTISIVLAHLPRSVAGKAIALLPIAQRKEVSLRLADISEIDGQIAMEIDAALRERFEGRTNRLSFDELDRLDNIRLSALFRSVDPQTAMLSLVGAKPALIERVIARFTPTEERQMQQSLRRFGAISDQDVQNARREILEHAFQ